jgi:tetratricopeptide (TPR) repeat protein
LDPDNAHARALRSGLLSARHRYDEAVAEAERAVQLEPASPGVRHAYASALAFNGRLDDAAGSERVALTLSPTYLFAHIWLGEIAAMKRDYAEMGREFQLVPPLAEVGRALVTMNTAPPSKPAVIQAIGAIRSSNSGLDAARKGWLYAAIGEVDLALTEFEAAIRHASGVSALQFPTVQRALGSSPRYKALLRTAGLAK